MKGVWDLETRYALQGGKVIQQFQEHHKKRQYRQTARVFWPMDKREDSWPALRVHFIQTNRQSLLGR